MAVGMRGRYKRGNGRERGDRKGFIPVGGELNPKAKGSKGLTHDQ